MSAVLSPPEPRSYDSWHEFFTWIVSGTGYILLLLLRWLENLEGAEEALVDAHHGAGIVELAAVVGGAEERDKLALREELVAVLDDLVSAADEVHVVFLQETRDDVRSKGERHTTVILGPPRYILVWIRPKQIAEQTAIGDLERTCQHWHQAESREGSGRGGNVHQWGA